MKGIYILAGVLAGFAGMAWYQKRNQNPNDSGSSVLIDIMANLPGSNGMRLSNDGCGKITQREAYRTDVYPDEGGLLTVGIGHLLVPADGDFSVGDQVTVDQINAWFNSDVAHAENIVNRFVTAPLNQNQFDALVSMAFNAGSRIFRNADGSDTHILAHLNAGDYQGAADAFMQWVYVHVNGVAVTSSGLLERRGGERSQFLA